MVTGKRILTTALAGVLLLVAVIPAGAATIAVRPGRDPVALSESFRLVFSATGSVDGAPDFTPLKKNFQILDQSSSSQISIVNGHFSRSTRWVLEVMAKRPGKLSIPPIHFGSDVSSAASVTVDSSATAPQGSKHGDGGLFLEVTATPKTPYVQAQVIYTVRLYRAVDLQSATLSAPKPVKGDAVIEKLGKALQYQTRRNGRTYAVIERKYAVFPQQSGTLTIAPVVFEGQVVEDDPTRLPSFGAVDQFNNFFNHFGGMLNQQEVHTVRLASSPVELHVRPIPASFTGKVWLPAKNLELQAGLSGNPPQWQVGTPVTRTLSIRATGLTAAQLPKLAAPLGQGLREYPDEPQLTQQKTADGVSGKRLEKVAIIPSRAGDYTLPAISIPWWDTSADRMEIARLPARGIHVAAATAQATAAPPAAAAGGSPSGGNPTPALAAPPLRAAPVPAAPAKPAIAPSRVAFWRWLSVILAAGWAVSLLAVVVLRRGRRQMKVPSTTAQPPRRPDPAQAWKRLEQACAAGDPKAARTELLGWARERWPGQGAASLEEIGPLCGAAAEREIRILNAHLYGRANSAPWRGTALLQALAAAQHPANTVAAPAAEGLEPLYKI